MEDETMTSSDPPDIVDYEHVLYNALVNEGKHDRVLSAKRQNYTYNEKQLRDAAALEVAKLTGTPNDDDDCGDEKGSRKRKQMTAEEKSKQNRDRNREHAKNTRLRKKAYVAKLKELVDQLSHQRGVEAKERVFLGKRIHDTQDLRKNAVRLFLSYRAANVQDVNKWATILDENFVFTIPITPYRAFNKREVISSQRVISGIEGLIADIASVALTVESVGQGTPSWVQAIRKGQRCRLWYDVGGHKEIMSAGEVVVCKFMERSEGHASVGAPSGLAVYGMLQCRFNKANKMVSGEMVFDVMSCMQQVQRAAMSGPDSNIILPNSLEGGRQHSNDARLIVAARSPFRVVHANEAWCKITTKARGQLIEESLVIGVEAVVCMNISPTQDPSVSISNEINVMLSKASRGVPGRVAYSRTRLDGTTAMVYVRAIPLASDDGSGEDHILLIIHEYDLDSSHAAVESGVLYPALTRSAPDFPTSRAPPSAWGMMSMHHASSGQFASSLMDDRFSWPDANSMGDVSMGLGVRDNLALPFSEKASSSLSLG